MSAAQDLDTPAWYCAATHPFQEIRAKYHLMEQGFDCLLPVTVQDSRRYKGPRLVALFPGYLFVAFTINEHWECINNTPGIRKLVAFGSPIPKPVPDEAIRTLTLVAQEFHSGKDLIIPPEAIIAVKRGRQRGLVGCHRWTQDGVVGMSVTLLGREVVLRFPKNNIYMLESRHG